MSEIPHGEQKEQEPKVEIKEYSDGYKERASMHRFAVVKDFRGREKGVSAKLYSTLLDFAQSHGYRKIFLGTAKEAIAAMKFYGRHGWRKIESLPEDVAQHPQLINDTNLYELDLEESVG